MAVKHEVKGRILIEKSGGTYLLRAKLEVYGGFFALPNGASIEAHTPATIEYRALLEPGRYYSPLEAPLPRPRIPYALIDFSVVYEHDPRISITHGAGDVQSTIVLTSTAYTMIDGAAYPHIAVTSYGNSLRLDEPILAAYPVLTGDPDIDNYIRYEYEGLRRGLEKPYLSAALTSCKPYRCKLEELWRKGVGAARLRLVARDWASLRGYNVEPTPIGVHHEPDRGVLNLKGYGLVALHLQCGGDSFVFEVFVNGVRTWKPWEGCTPRLSGYSSLCPFCLQPA